MYLLKEQISNWLERCPKDEGTKIIEDFFRKIRPYLDSSDVKDLYDDEYRKILKNHPTVILINSKYPIHAYGISMFHYLRDKIEKTDNILEIGCDSGNLLLGLMESTSGNGQFVGLDFNENSIREAKCKVRDTGKDNCVFYCCDANHFKSEMKFKYIILNDVIEHLSDREMKRLMRSCKRMLSSDGEIVMHTPNGLNICCLSDQTLLSALYFIITGDKVVKSSRQIYYEQMHINVKSYRQWKHFFRNCGYSLAVKYDREGDTRGGGVNVLKNTIRTKLQLNCNMLLIAKLQCKKAKYGGYDEKVIN